MGLNWEAGALAFAGGYATSHGEDLKKQDQWEREMRREEVRDTRAQSFRLINDQNQWNQQDKTNKQADTWGRERSVIENKNKILAAKESADRQDSRVGLQGQESRKNTSFSQSNAVSLVEKQHQAYVEKSLAILKESNLSPEYKEAAELLIYLSRPGERVDIYGGAKKAVGGGKKATVSENQKAAKFVSDVSVETYDRAIEANKTVAEATELSAEAARKAAIDQKLILNSNKESSMFVTDKEITPPAASKGSGSDKPKVGAGSTGGDVKTTPPPKDDPPPKGEVAQTKEEFDENTQLYKEYADGDLTKVQMVEKFGGGTGGMREFMALEGKQKTLEKERVRQMAQAIEGGMLREEAFTAIVNEREKKAVEDLLVKRGRGKSANLRAEAARINRGKE